MKVQPFLISANIIFFSISHLLFAQIQENIQSERKKAVVHVKAYKEMDVIDKGAGIVVGYDPPFIYILTAYHIVQEGDSVTNVIFVEFYKKPEINAKANVLYFDQANDCAVLRLEGAEFIDAITPMRMADLSRLPAETSTVYAIGHPEGRIWSVKKGEVLHAYEVSTIAFTGDAVKPGNSGGPLLNDKAELIGMVAKTSASEAKAYRIDLARRQLDQWLIPTNNLRIDAPVAFAELKPASKDLEVGDTTRLTLSLWDSDRNMLFDRAVVWRSSDITIAKVNEKGETLGLRPGRATITASCEGKTERSAITIVKPAVASIELNSDSLKLGDGQTKRQLAAILKDARGKMLTDHKIKWKSSNKSIVRVSKNGEVEVERGGTAFVTASCEGVVDTIWIQVAPSRMVRMGIVFDSWSSTSTMILGTSLKLSTRNWDQYGKEIGNTHPIIWSCSDNSIATVSENGEVRGLRTGEVVISARCDSFSDRRTITIIGGLIHISVESRPLSVRTYYPDTGCEPAEVIITVVDQFSKPLPEAKVVVNCSFDFVKFSGSGTNRIEGRTDNTGTFRTSVSVDYGPYSFFNLSIYADKEGYEYTNASYQVGVLHEPGPLIVQASLNPTAISSQGGYTQIKVITTTRQGRTIDGVNILGTSKDASGFYSYNGFSGITDARGEFWTTWFCNGCPRGNYYITIEATKPGFTRGSAATISVYVQ